MKRRKKEASRAKARTRAVEASSSRTPRRPPKERVLGPLRDEHDPHSGSTGFGERVDECA
jgi:hypothetical protein